MKKLISVLAILILFGCGGGGSDSNSTTSSSTTLPSSNSNVVLSTLQTGTFNSTYSNPNLTAVFSTLNQWRTQCGLGALKQNTALDLASQNHINYLVLNNEYSHSETYNLPGFTGATHSDQTEFSGYIYGNGVVLNGGQVSELLELHNLMGVPYHQNILTAAMIDIGLASGSSTGYGLILNIFVGYGSYGQDIAGDELAVFPCQDTTVDVSTQGNEYPSPVDANTIWGYTLSARVNEKQTITVNSWTLKDSNGNAIPVSILTANNDPNKYLQNNQANLIPLQLLKKGMAYTSNIEGSNNGVSFTKRWTFNTAP